MAQKLLEMKFKLFNHNEKEHNQTIFQKTQRKELENHQNEKLIEGREEEEIRETKLEKENIETQNLLNTNSEKQKVNDGQTLKNNLEENEEIMTDEFERYFGSDLINNDSLPEDENEKMTNVKNQFFEVLDTMEIEEESIRRAVKDLTKEIKSETELGIFEMHGRLGRSLQSYITMYLKKKTMVSKIQSYKRQRTDISELKGILIILNFLRIISFINL